MRKHLIALTLLAATGCASTTVIESRPSGAKVRLNGATVGRTPYVHSDTEFSGTAKNFSVEMEGYESRQVVVKRDQWGNGKTVLSILFFLPGLLWSAEYPPQQLVELESTSDQARPAQEGLGGSGFQQVR